MSLSVAGQMDIGSVVVTATSGRGLNPDELTAMAMRRILHIGDNTPPVIRAQAEAFKDEIAQTIRNHLAQAQRSERTTVIAALDRAGEHAAADIVRKL